MKEPTKNYTPSETTKLFDGLNKVLYILGLRNFWVDDVKLPKKFVKVYDTLYSTMYVLNWIFCFMQIGGIFTQKHLTQKQYSDTVVLGICQPLTHLCCLNCIYNRKRCRQVLFYLAIVLKDVYNDKETEQNMIKKLKLFLVMYSLSVLASWGYYGLIALIEVVRSDAIFVAIVTAWPDVTDTSTVASCARIGLYLYWCVSFFRMSTVFFIVLVLFISLSHQYKNMYRYFESLNSIFEDTQLSRKEMEMKFEKALAMGILAHSDTIWCAQQAQIICNEISSLIVLLATTMMPVMLNCSTFDELMTHMTTLVISIVIMGIFMWNAGDITVEKPVVFTAFGVVELSYETFVTIIKTAYSMVSVFYS